MWLFSVGGTAQKKASLAATVSTAPWIARYVPPLTKLNRQRGAIGTGRLNDNGFPWRVPLHAGRHTSKTNGVGIKFGFGDIKQNIDFCATRLTQWALSCLKNNHNLHVEYVDTFTCFCMCKRERLNMCAYIHTYIYIYIYTYTDARIHVGTHAYVCVCACMTLGQRFASMHAASRTYSCCMHVAGCGRMLR